MQRLYPYVSFNRRNKVVFTRILSLSLLLLLCLRMTAPAATQKNRANKRPIRLMQGYIEIATNDNPLYKLQARLTQGDKSALLEIAPYFDSKKMVLEYLGWHTLQTAESDIAKRIIEENCLFTDDEIQITTTTTAQQFSDFLKRSKEKIVFSELAASYLITPLEKRDIKVEVREISERKRKELQSRREELLQNDKLRQYALDTLIQQKNPRVLLLIASELFRRRDRFNSYNFDGNDYTDILQLLTGTEIGAADQEKKISWNVGKDYYHQSKYNLLVYFSQQYPQYLWNDKQSRFINPNIPVRPLEKEEELFELLSDTNNLVAIDAFRQLTMCNPASVLQIAREYSRVLNDYNKALPLFQESFLRQLVLLTEYCQNNNIDYIGSTYLRNNITLLQSELSFTQRRKLEDELIRTLSLDDITALEYWALIYEQSGNLSYSAGRILDMCYSRNWNTLLTDKKQRDCYLKKSKLFQGLNIIGVCNNYLKKFSNASAQTLELLRNYASRDSNIQEQAALVIALNNAVNKGYKRTKKTWNGNRDSNPNGIIERIKKITTQAHRSEKKDEEIERLLSDISYQQIPMAMQCIEHYTFFDSLVNKYSFMEYDWGFFMAGDFSTKEARNEFLRLYAKYSEYELYAYYIDLAGIDYKQTDGTLDYDKIYELLKYDVVDAFSGGVGGRQDNEVYSLIKLLELTFKTRLGYPQKFCKSQGLYFCTSEDRARDWMKYLRKQKLLKQAHNEPISFHDD